MRHVLAAIAIVLVLPGAAGGRAAADVTPPVITYSFSGASGNDEWYRSDVTVTWYVSDAESIYSAGSECVSPSAMTSNGETRSCSATSSGGSSSITTKAVKIDKVAPSGVSASAARGADSNGWYTSPVGVSFSGSDGTSGIAGCTSTTYG